VVNRANPHVKARFAGQGPYEIDLVRNHPQNGKHLLKLTVNNSPASFKDSLWTLVVKAADTRDSAPLNAWIERTSSRPPSAFTTHDSHDLTLSIPGTSRSVIAVGAIDANDPIIVGGFSSYGPTLEGDWKPDIAAPGVGVIAASSGTGDGVTVMDGTSMAAPHVTGAVALVFSKCLRTGRPLPNANQVRSDLQRTTKNRLSAWDKGQGFGVIDVSKLLAEY
jgi:endonuclease G